MSESLDPCEHCGLPCEEHDAGDVVDCIANDRDIYGGSDAYDAIWTSLRGARDYNAALALYWWIHNASEDATGESWPVDEDALRAIVYSQRRREPRDPTKEQCDAARRLCAAAGGWWWRRDGNDALFTVEQKR